MFRRLALKAFAPYYCPKITPELESEDEDVTPGYEFPSINFYTGSGFNEINRALTSGNPTSLKPQSQQYLENLLVLIVTSKKGPKTVYRGIDSRAADKYRTMKVGDVIQKAAFMSTSVSLGVADNFALDDGVILKLNVASGSKALYVTDDREKEWIFPPESFYKITKLSTDSDDRLVVEGILGIQPKFKKPKYATQTASDLADIVHTGKVWAELPDGSIR